MPSNATSKQIPKQSPLTAPDLDATTAYAVEALNTASMGEFCIDELRTVLRAIVRISGGDEITRSLAMVGCGLADKHFDAMSDQHEGLRDRVAELKARSGVQA
jgi:hypothetical protein